MGIFKQAIDAVRKVSGPELRLLVPARAEILITYPHAPPARYRMCTAAVEATIAAFGAMRAAMLPEVSKTWPTGAAVKCCRDPIHSVEFDQLSGDPVLHLRDERFGWLHYMITKAEARKLGEALIAQADAPPPATAGRA